MGDLLLVCHGGQVPSQLVFCCPNKKKEGEIYVLSFKGSEVPSFYTWIVLCSLIHILTTGGWRGE